MKIRILLLSLLATGYTFCALSVQPATLLGGAAISAIITAGGAACGGIYAEDDSMLLKGVGSISNSNSYFHDEAVIKKHEKIDKDMNDIRENYAHKGATGGSIMGMILSLILMHKSSCDDVAMRSFAYGLFGGSALLGMLLWKKII